MRLVGQAVRGEPDPIRAEAGRLDQVRAGLEVFAMDRADEIRARRRQLVEAGALGQATAEQQGSHPAVGQQRGDGEPLGEALTLVHAESLPEHRVGSPPSDEA